MKKTTEIKLEDAIKNAEKYIAQMEKMDDKKLSKHIDLLREQMEKAFQQKNHVACKLLYEYEQQVIVARIKKFDQSQKMNKPHSHPRIVT